MKNNIGVQTHFHSEIIVLLKLYLVSPTTNAVSERSASSMRRIKNWLRSTMSQERLNHSMLLSIYKEKTDEISLKNVANVFCEANEERRRTFGIFCDTDFLLLKRLKCRYLKKKQFANVNGISESKENTYLFFKFIF